MVQKTNNDLEDTKPAYMYYLMTKSGQCSPTSDTMDSGTGSDLETTTPSILMARKNSNTSLNNAVAKSIRRFSDLSIQMPDNKRTTNGQHRIKNRSTESYNTDSEESESSLSCDSLNSTELLRMKNIDNRSSTTSSSISTTSPIPSSQIFTSDENNVTKINFLPHSLLRDIRDHSLTLTKHSDNNNSTDISQTINNKIIIKNHVSFSDDERIDENNSNCKFSDCSSETASSVDSFIDGNTMSMPSTKTTKISFGETKVYENDKYYNFHINERIVDPMNEERKAFYLREDDTFAGYRDISARVPASTIRSSKGTIRGVKNRVRNGIATFLQMQQTNVKVKFK